LCRYQWLIRTLLMCITIYMHYEIIEIWKALLTEEVCLVWLWNLKFFRIWLLVWLFLYPLL
jgi:hypothetical protein